MLTPNAHWCLHRRLGCLQQCRKYNADPCEAWTRHRSARLYRRAETLFPAAQWPLTSRLSRRPNHPALSASARWDARRPAGLEDGHCRTGERVAVPGRNGRLADSLPANGSPVRAAQVWTCAGMNCEMICRTASSRSFAPRSSASEASSGCPHGPPRRFNLRCALRIIGLGPADE